MAAISDVRDVLDDSGALKNCKLEYRRGCETGSPKGHSGSIVLTNATKHIFDLVSLTFDELLRR